MVRIPPGGACQLRKKLANLTSRGAKENIFFVNLKGARRAVDGEGRGTAKVPGRDQFSTGQ